MLDTHYESFQSFTRGQHCRPRRRPVALQPSFVHRFFQSPLAFTSYVRSMIFHDPRAFLRASRFRSNGIRNREVHVEKNVSSVGQTNGNDRRSIAMAISIFIATASCYVNGGYRFLDGLARAMADSAGPLKLRSHRVSLVAEEKILLLVENSCLLSPLLFRPRDARWNAYASEGVFSRRENACGVASRSRRRRQSSCTRKPRGRYSRSCRNQEGVVNITQIRERWHLPERKRPSGGYNQ